MKKLTFAIFILSLLVIPLSSSAQGVLDRIFNRDSEEGVFDDLRETRENREQRVIETRESLEQRNQRRVEERKRDISQLIVRGLNSANEALSDRYLIFLNRLNGILDKIEANAERNDVELEGLEDLRDELNVLIREVLDQKEKNYSIEIEDIENVRSEFQIVKEEFLQDHRELRGKILGMIEGVRELFSELKEQVPDEEEEDEEESDEEDDLE